jgi:hypothetical protein
MSGLFSEEPNCLTLFPSASQPEEEGALIGGCYAAHFKHGHAFLKVILPSN